MGFTVTRIAHPAGRPDAGPIDRAISAAMPVRVVPPMRRWAVLDVVRRDDSVRLMTVVDTMHRLAGEFGLPSLVVHVEDSDCSLIIGIRPSVDPVLVVFNPEAAEDYSDPAEVTERVAVDGEGLAEWSSQVGRPGLEADEIERLSEQKWTFAEEPIEILADSLNLPLLESPAYLELEGLLDLIDSREIFGTVSYRMSETRYAVGVGDGFHGVWDRKNPGPPIRVFPGDKDGFLAANDEYNRLMLELPEEERRL